MSTRSFIWDYFKKQDGQASCNYCKLMLKCNNTTNLASHLERKHPLAYSDFIKKKNGSSNSCSEATMEVADDEENE